MARLADWEKRLADYIAEAQLQPFKWGEWDCALFAAGAALAMTGEDRASAFRNRYTTAMGSTKALKRYGGGTLKSAFDMHYPDKPIGFAVRGDLVMYDGAMGVCVGPVALFMPMPDEPAGLVRIERALWHKAWAV